MPENWYLLHELSSKGNENTAFLNITTHLYSGNGGAFFDGDTLKPKGKTAKREWMSYVSKLFFAFSFMNCFMKIRPKY